MCILENHRCSHDRHRCVAVSDKKLVYEDVFTLFDIYCVL